MADCSGDSILSMASVFCLRLPEVSMRLPSQDQCCRCEYGSLQMLGLDTFLMVSSRRNPYRMEPVQALSEASLEDVNSMWAGLGYYRRARFLLEGAQYVVQHHGGSFPKTSKELQKIPGELPGQLV